jgi:hypothetical protein
MEKSANQLIRMRVIAIEHSMEIAVIVKQSGKISN